MLAAASYMATHSGFTVGAVGETIGGGVAGNRANSVMLMISTGTSGLRSRVRLARTSSSQVMTGSSLSLPVGPRAILHSPNARDRDLLVLYSIPPSFLSFRVRSVA